MNHPQLFLISLRPDATLKAGSHFCAFYCRSPISKLPLSTNQPVQAVAYSERGTDLYGQIPQSKACQTEHYSGVALCPEKRKTQQTDANGVGDFRHIGVHYFLGQFASAEGKKGGEFYTPRCIVKLLVEMLRPYKGWVYDPCCGSGGMFVQSEEFIKAHGGRIGDISVYGQELNYTTWRLCKMNLAIRGIDGRIEQGDSFLNDRFPDLKADYILANPPFNMKEWGGEHLREDKRWKFGIPPVNNANFAWVQQ